jgi:hypothetical protein
MSKPPKKVFRIANLDPNRGLWYNPNGKYTGEIHSDLTFCRSSALKMPYDEKLAKVWRSATNSENELLNWFNLDELILLEKFGFYVAIYATKEYKNHIHTDPDTGVKLSHIIFKIASSQLIELVPVEKFRKMLTVQS